MIDFSEALKSFEIMNVVKMKHKDGVIDYYIFYDNDILYDYDEALRLTTHKNILTKFITEIENLKGYNKINNYYLIDNNAIMV